ncbi:hypothetical protein [Leptospira sp. GIMC2001]|uniref:hypothetical protein n=1 Tax=Leptospira sp. GIMC2001 TaxID=1513297 RepID=UPI00234AB01C|nr:hypothetical protein [Leptospira sp. GIMC2001]WCL50648.1 hypothetical protein O4O04_07495 [Leptospira sp. GIMC2001]
MQRIIDLLYLGVIVFCLNCFPNFQSPREECKEGKGLKQGKEADANYKCSLSFMLAKEGRNSNGEITPAKISMDAAILICLKAVDDIQNCNNKHAMKTGLGSIK